MDKAVFTFFNYTVKHSCKVMSVHARILTVYPPLQLYPVQLQ
jgi:hypothetical protein